MNERDYTIDKYEMLAICWDTSKCWWWMDTMRYTWRTCWKWWIVPFCNEKTNYSVPTEKREVEACNLENRLAERSCKNIGAKLLSEQ